MVVVAVVRWEEEEDDNTFAMTTAVCWTGRLLSSIGTAAEGCKRGSCQHTSEREGLARLDSVGAPRCCEEQCVEFGSVRPGRLPRRAMELVAADAVVCRAEVSAADVERFGASLSSEQRALVTTFNTDGVKFTAWPELVRLFPNLDRVCASRCGLVEFPLALCALPNLRVLNLSYNDFVEIPSEVSRLQQLERAVSQWVHTAPATALVNQHAHCALHAAT